MTRAINPAQLDASIKAGRITVTDAKGEKIARLVESRRKQIALAEPVKPLRPSPVARNVVESFTLVVQIDVPSVNKATRNLGAWMRTKALVKEAVYAAWLSAGRPIIVKPFTHAVTFHGNRKRDPMNRAWVLWKPGVDGLVSCGALPGDGFKWDCGGSYASVHDETRNCAVWRFWVATETPEF